ncbi:MAG: SMC-Scp complex subunit ScpB [Planctomycetaceae bacterium]|nr:SMC-Scp complex subunit ScpB [Planctomycetaceae bacterium]
MSLSQVDPPFQAVVPGPAVPAAGLDEPMIPVDDDWSLADLEDAYQRALESADAVAEQVELEAPAPELQTIAAPTAQSSVNRVATSVEAFTVAETIQPEQILEALLFVGGDGLTGRRLADLLGGDRMHGVVDDAITHINARYFEQCRPYQILLGEGGYRLSLRPELESVRSRVYGMGPRDVRLSQDALEVLALIAYKQPILREDIEATGKPNVAALVRQLLRLELISLERGTGGKDDIRYRTTSRFLQLFALDRLEDLPHPEDLMFR